MARPQRLPRGNLISWWYSLLPLKYCESKGIKVNQRSTVGWKALLTAKIIQDLAICRYEVAASV